MAFDYISHVCSAAVTDLQVVSVEYFVELVWLYFQNTFGT